MSGREGPNGRLYSADRVVVLSPHLGDAVLSLGGTLAGLARLGGLAEIVTVLAGDPGSMSPAGLWDLRTGFHTGSEAGEARREEDLHLGQCSSSRQRGTRRSRWFGRQDHASVASIPALERRPASLRWPSGGRCLHHPTGAKPRQVPVPALAPDERLGER